ncbi:hypothetical protein [Ruegeria sp. Ofav3-42]|uniref:hypothetical protein n=1 Tax=Ruegeria sp. Ofav3-42 TaxID=2917759 RepID=UPI001EF5EF5C|nr:hypothetical protein [Ruegeria sp. Ofav3-42]MCG7520271.1 hypothetical protein [Ruegeria sp. Ofav3-42]
MKRQDISMIRQILPNEMTFHYYPDRQSPWLLCQSMDEETSVSDLKQTDLSRLLSRPLLQPMVAQCGGVLRRHDVMAVAHADRAMQWDGLGPAAKTGLEAAYQSQWLDFCLSFDIWSGEQTTRKAHNLVVQLGFPTEHAELLWKFGQRSSVDQFQSCWHPVRTDGRPTLSWCRLDIDLASGTCLIEEIQSDWLRFVGRARRRLQNRAPRSRQLRLTTEYEQALQRQYAKIWGDVMMLAVLVLLRDEFAVRTVWMHQPASGARLKGINWGRLPPRSVYTKLPRSFGFEPTRDAPPFLGSKQKSAARRAVQDEQPTFWRLSF